MTDIYAGIPAIEAQYRQTVVAVVLDDAGAVYDHAFNWETAQSMALSDGYRIVAVADDGAMTRDDIQALCDAERARYRDCFGIEPMPADPTTPTP